LMRLDRPESLLLLLGISALARTVLSVALSRQPLRVRTNSLKLIRDTKDLARPLLGEYLAMNLLGQLSVLAVSAMLGLSATAGLRAAQAVFGPLNTLQNAIRVAVTPEFVRRSSIGAEPRGHVRLLGTVVVLATTAWIAAVLVTPDKIGTALFGESWALAVPLLLAVGTQRIAGAFQIGPLVGLRASGATRSAALIRSCGAVVSVGAVVVAAAVADIFAVAWAATAASALVTAVILWLWAFGFRRISR
jgi:O-antigen/teichoic acid export membrane protein